MNDNLVDLIDECLQKGELLKAIEIAEKKLRDLPLTKFHAVLDNDLLSLSTNLVSYITDFYHHVNSQFNVKVIYSEMNGFTINCDAWFIDLFAYSSIGADEDLDWLAEFDISSEKSMVISGFGNLQLAFDEYMENENWKDVKEKEACEVCEYLVILRLQQLFNATKQFAHQNELIWKDIPIYVTAHDYDLIYVVK